MPRPRDMAAAFLWTFALVSAMIIGFMLSWPLLVYSWNYWFGP